MPKIPQNRQKCQKKGNFVKTFWRVFFINALVVCAFCWLQCFLDLLGLDRSVTLLCAGCTYEMFGFPHPNGFAIEPQFMGNLLLAPTLAALYFAATHYARPKQNKTGSARASSVRADSSHIHSVQPAFPRRIYLALSAIFSATLFLTFSRGAIYAFVIGLIILLIFALKNHHFRPTLIIIPAAAFLFTLVCQGIFATISPTSDNFLTATTKSIHQLSLGLIDLRPEEVKNAATESAAIDSDTSDTSDESINFDKTSVFNGYVAGSTNTRLSLTSSALSVWSSTPVNLLFGAGLGSAGTVLYQSGLTTSPKEIVQNEYASILLELGIIGLILALALIFLIFYYFRSQPLAASLFAAYLVTFLFFSGPANALQIYLLPTLIFLILQIKTPQTKTQRIKAQQVKTQNFSIDLATFEKSLILVLPPLLFFSYYPIISLGASASMNFELSLPLLWLPVFCLATLRRLPALFRWLKDQFKNRHPAILIFITAFALILYSTLSILWSPNPLRALLTAAIYWLILYSVVFFTFFFSTSVFAPNTTRS